MSKRMIINAISIVIALNASPLLAESESGKAMMQASPLKGMEKCFGVAKAGMNDCGNASHTCGGEAKVDRDKHEWLLMPEGLCKRIAGGSTTPQED